MRNLLVGFLMGAFLVGAVAFGIKPFVFSPLEMGRFLDRDTIHTQQGTIFHGWIINETEDQILIETDKGRFTLDRKELSRIDYNHALRYLRDLRELF